jgi:hypothetical protein
MSLSEKPSARIKMVTPSGQLADLVLVSEDGVELLKDIMLFESTAFEMGYERYGTKPAQVGTAPTYTAPATGEVEIGMDQDPQPGQLFKRFRLHHITVTPRADGKTEVKLFGNDKIPDGNQYEYATIVQEAPKIIDRFAGVASFTLEDMQKAGRFELAADIEMRYGSNRTSQGNYYRNVTAITLPPGMGPQDAQSSQVEEPPMPEMPDDIPF